MKVLSLFDGISCGRVAFEKAGIHITNYYASEIDKYAIQIARKNYPNTIHLGCVKQVRRMVEAGLFGHVDYLIGGSPCQGFSLAGKQLAFNDPRSALFFEFVAILNTLRKTNPNIKFLLENVKMKQQHLDVITSFLGVEPVRINSALVSAQNRVRFYWCNRKVEQPADHGIFLKDILEKNYSESELCDSGQINRLLNSTDVSKSFSKIDPDKAVSMTARQYSNWKGTFITIPVGGRIPFSVLALNEITYRKLSPLECERLQTLPDNYTEGVSNSQRYKMLGNGWTVDVIAHILRGSK